MRTKKIGVLALQGSVEEHLHTLSQIEAAEGFPIRTKEELSRAEAIILPGGESTTLRKLLREFDLEDPLRRRITGGMPVWGTCAGMILLAREVEGGESTLSDPMQTASVNGTFNPSSTAPTSTTVHGSTRVWTSFRHCRKNADFPAPSGSTGRARLQTTPRRCRNK